MDYESKSKPGCLGWDLEILWDKEMRGLQGRRKRIYIIVVVIILCVAYVCWENVCMWRSKDNFVEFVVSFYIYMGSRNEAKVVRLVWQAFYPPSCVPGKMTRALHMWIQS